MANLRNIVDINNLKTLGIYELRNLARSIGVSRPTTLVRKELIEKIIEQFNSQTEPQPQNTRGRPPRYSSFDLAKIIEPDAYQGIYGSVFDAPNDDTVQSSIKSTDDVTYLRGFIHLVPRGHAYLISSCLNTFFVPVKLVVSFKLETGDSVEATAVKTESGNGYIVQEITKLNGICPDKYAKEPKSRFDRLEGNRPSVQIGNLGIKYGQRCLVQTPKVFDRIESIAEYKTKMKDTYKIALLLEETDDTIEYLKQNGVEDVFLAKVNYNLKKQVMLVLIALFTAKHNALEGKNVILFVDNLNKLFKIYNTSSFDNGQMIMSQVNLGHLVDLKTLFMSSKAFENGSLTTICYVNEPKTETDIFVFNEFCDITNVLIQH